MTVPRLILGFSVAMLFAAVGCQQFSTGRSAISPASVASSAPAQEGKSLSPSLAAKACFATAESLEQQNYPSEAVSQYEKARGYDPNLPEVAKRLAVLYDQLGLPFKAVEEFQKALDREPNNADLLNDI